MADQTDAVAQFHPHGNTVGYHETKLTLLQIITTFWQAVSLPGNHVAWPIAPAITLPCSRMHLPHSQRKVVQYAIQDFLQEGDTQGSFFLLSPVFLVPKKDGSYLPVIGFRKVNDLTVPDHYPIPVLSILLQSIGKHNTWFPALTCHSHVRFSDPNNAGE